MCLYDGLNRRIMRNKYSPPGTLTESRFFVYSDQWQVLEEYVAATSLTVPVVQWVWGIRYIDDCVLRDSATAARSTLRLYALQDANWNVVALYNPATSAVVERYAYTPFGVVQFLNASFDPIERQAPPTPGKPSTAATVTTPRSAYILFDTDGCILPSVPGLAGIRLGLHRTWAYTATSLMHPQARLIRAGYIVAPSSRNRHRACFRHSTSWPGSARTKKALPATFLE